MGSSRQALALILDLRRDVGAALDFVAASGDPELWPLLLDQAINWTAVHSS